MVPYQSRGWNEEIIDWGGSFDPTSSWHGQTLVNALTGPFLPPRCLPYLLSHSSALSRSYWFRRSSSPPLLSRPPVPCLIDLCDGSIIGYGIDHPFKVYTHIHVYAYLLVGCTGGFFHLWCSPIWGNPCCFSPSFIFHTLLILVIVADVLCWESSRINLVEFHPTVFSISLMNQSINPYQCKILWMNRSDFFQDVYYGDKRDSESWWNV